MDADVRARPAGRLRRRFRAVGVGVEHAGVRDSVIGDPDALVELTILATRVRLARRRSTSSRRVSRLS
jgi:hypothetical protein